jgi:PAS domain S-box-containing protein
MDTPAQIQQELLALRDDLRAAGVAIEPETDVTSVAGLQRLRAAMRTALAQRRQAMDEAQAERDAHRMLQLVLDTMPIRVFWKDRDLRFQGANLLLAHDTGYASPEELIGKTDYDTTSRDMAERYRADDRAVMESGVAKIGYEEPQTAADGSRVWLYTSKIPLRNAKGEIIGVLGLYEDITARKRIEEELRTSEQRLAKIFETAIVGLVIHAPDGTIVQCNATARDLLGVSLGEVRGKTFGEQGYFIHEDGTRILPDEYPEYVIPRTKQTVRNAVTGFRSPGLKETRWLLVNAVPLFDEHGTVTEVIVSFIDITERKQAEHDREALLVEVNRRAAELDATIAAMADGVIIYDTAMYVQRMNAGAERILGYTTAEATGTLANRLGTAHFRTLEDTPVAVENYPAVRAAVGQTVRGVIYSMTRRDGRRFWVSLSAAPIRLDKTVIGAVVTFTEASESAPSQ